METKREIQEIIFQANQKQKRIQKLSGTVTIVLLLIIGLLNYFEKYLATHDVEGNLRYTANNFIKIANPLALLSLIPFFAIWIAKWNINHTNDKQIELLNKNSNLLAWIYIQSTRVPFSWKMSNSIKLWTYDNKVITIFISSLPLYVGSVEKFIYAIQFHYNPSCLVGYSEENVKKYRELIKHGRGT